MRTVGFIKHHNPIKFLPPPLPQPKTFCLQFPLSVLPIKGSSERRTTSLLLKGGVTKVTTINIPKAIDPFLVECIWHENGRWKTPSKHHRLWKKTVKHTDVPQGRELDIQLAMLQHFCACALTLLGQKSCFLQIFCDIWSIFSFRSYLITKCGFCYIFLLLHVISDYSWLMITYLLHLMISALLHL